jgi:hypothetical protein
VSSGNPSELYAVCVAAVIVFAAAAAAVIHPFI